jgi:hypothetical protein
MLTHVHKYTPRRPGLNGHFGKVLLKNAPTASIRRFPTIGNQVMPNDNCFLASEDATAFSPFLTHHISLVLFYKASKQSAFFHVE